LNPHHATGVRSSRLRAMGKAETYKAGRVTSFFAHHRLQQRGSKLLDARIAKDKKPPKQWKPPYTSNCGPRR